MRCDLNAEQLDALHVPERDIVNIAQDCGVELPFGRATGGRIYHYAGNPGHVRIVHQITVEDPALARYVVAALNAVPSLLSRLASARIERDNVMAWAVEHGWEDAEGGE